MERVKVLDGDMVSGLSVVRTRDTLTAMDEPTTTPQELGAILRQARDDAEMTLDDVIVEFSLRNIPSSMKMSRGKIGQLEKGYVAHPDPWDLLLLATVYGKELRDISPEAADDIDSYRQFVSQRPDPESPSRWTTDVSMDELAQVA